MRVFAINAGGALLIALASATPGTSGSVAQDSQTASCSDLPAEEAKVEADREEEEEWIESGGMPNPQEEEQIAEEEAEVHDLEQRCKDQAESSSVDENG